MKKTIDDLYQLLESVRDELRELREELLGDDEEVPRTGKKATTTAKDREKVNQLIEEGLKGLNIPVAVSSISYDKMVPAKFIAILPKRGFRRGDWMITVLTAPSKGLPPRHVRLMLRKGKEWISARQSGPFVGKGWHQHVANEALTQVKRLFNEGKADGTDGD